MKRVGSFIQLVMLLALMVAPSLAGQQTDSNHVITVARHASVSFSMSDVTSRLKDGTDRLRIKNRNSDCSCCVRLMPPSSVLTFGAVGDLDDVVISQAQLDRLLAINTARVKVIADITAVGLCGSSGTILACADGQSIVIRSSASGGVWAHEFGHNQGLIHRSSTAELVMHKTPTVADEINKDECDHFVSGGTTGANCTLIVCP